MLSIAASARKAGPARRAQGGAYNGDAMSAFRPGSIDDVLQQSAPQCQFLTARERAGGWRAAFGAAADRLPQPFWLYAEDEATALVLGFPLTVSGAWEAFVADLRRLLDAEIVFRCQSDLDEKPVKGPLIEQRQALAQRLGELVENALLHDHGQRLPEILWLALTREFVEQVRPAVRAASEQLARLGPDSSATMRMTLGNRLASLAQRGEEVALARLRRQNLEPPPAAFALSRLLRQDLLPLVLDRVPSDLKELSAHLQLHLHENPTLFHRRLFDATLQLGTLRQRDASFDRTLTLVAGDVTHLTDLHLLFCNEVLDLLELWEHPETPRLAPDFAAQLRDLGGLFKRMDVLGVLRHRIFPIGLRGSRAVTRIAGQLVRLSAFTRPLDFTVPGVVESVVRRYGLIYDLVEFTQLLEELRRRGRGTEEEAMRHMMNFQRQVEAIFEHHRLRFEKFLGDGAFYSARSSRAVLGAATELRTLYERLRTEGFPFDRGLRLAVNVGTYHLFALARATEGRPHFEFLGHGLVELARLTTGKSTKEVEDITDFLIASGYDVHQVLAFLEPVRHASRAPEHAHERPYVAYLAENGELVNRGGVATEAFLHDLEAESEGMALREATAFGVRWVAVPARRDGDGGPWAALRLLGTARLKGLEPTPLAELAVIEELPAEAQEVGDGGQLLARLRTVAGGLEAADGGAAGSGAEDVDPHLCVASVLDEPGSRAWYIGLFHEEVDALFHTFRIPLNPFDLRDGEPFESWLFGRRQELTKLYQGLRRDGLGATLSLETLRARDGYLTCLLVAPHRSPR